ncbi:MAG: hypothetical protein OEX19_04795 [Gammaproteobacteria bacterium]|nr:hypothetical protein [Gammaproteobacteria bacterium]
MSTISISTVEDVAALVRDVRTGKRRHVNEIIIRLDGIEKEQADQLSQEINKNYFACGCSEATALGLAGLAAALVWMGNRFENWQNFSLQDGLIVVGAFIIATGVGKAIGHLRARIALKTAVDKLISYVPEVQNIGKGDGSAMCSVGK